MKRLRSTMIPLEKRITKASFAVQPVDALSSESELKGFYEITIKGFQKPPLKHDTGYLLFLNVPDGKYTLITEGNYYVRAEIEIDTKEIETKLLLSSKINVPLLKIHMKPNPYYPFPINSTLIKGTITHLTGRPLSDVIIIVKERQETAVSDEQGEFVLYFKALEANEQKINLQLTKKGLKAVEVEETIKKGTRKEVSYIL